MTQLAILTQDSCFTNIFLTKMSDYIPEISQ
jgi:hypothetical protein